MSDMSIGSIKYKRKNNKLSKSEYADDKRFKKKKPDNRGSVTVFLIFAFLALMLLLIGTILLLRYNWEKTQMNRLSNISAETLLSKYYKPLFDEYRLFYYMDVDKEAAEADMMTEFVGNQDKVPDILKVKPSSLSITERRYATDGGCQNVLDQIDECAKYCCAEKAYETFKEQYLGLLNGHADTNSKLDEISDDINEYEEEAKVEEDVLRLLRAVEGITVKGGNISSGNVYVKCGIYGEVNADNAGIDNNQVWQAVCNKDFNIKVTIDKLIEEADSGADGKSARYPKAKVNDLIIKLKQIRNKNDEALSLADGIIKGISGKDVKIICDVAGMREKINENNRILDVVLELEHISVPNSKETWQEFKDTLLHYDELLSGYHVRDLRFDYSTLNTKKADDPRDSGDYRGEGILGFLIDVDKLSNAAMPEAKTYESLYEDGDYEAEYSEDEDEGASADFSDTDGLDRFIDECKSDELFDMLSDKINIQLYIDMFFTDYMSEDTGEADVLKYKKEYIIAGKESDTENLKSIVNRLILARSGETFIYLVLDEKSRAEAYAVAASLVGFTGMDALVRCVQFMILGLWAYEDSCVDIGILLNGKKIPMIKDSVNLSFPEIVLFSKEYVKSKIEAAADTGSLSYNMVLQTLLALKDDRIKLFRVMDLIQADMKIKYDTNFSFQDAMFGMKASYECSTPFFYETEIQYSY